MSAKFSPAANLAALAVLSVIVLSACVATAPPPKQPIDPNQTGVNVAVTKTQSGFEDAALTPLSDLNLRQVPIPERLEQIRSPYEPIKHRDCPGIGAEVNELTTILGADVDVASADENFEQKSGDTASSLALNGVKDAVTGFIPYRSLVRMATGASEHERQLRAAYDKGVQRRAYLKGVGFALGCVSPAAPDPKHINGPTRPKIEYRNPDDPPHTSG